MAGQQIHTRFIIVILSAIHTLTAAQRFPSRPPSFYHFARGYGRNLRFAARRPTMVSAVEQTVNTRAGWLERALAGLDGLARRRGRSNVPAHLATGIEGEDAAFFFLRGKGY